MWQWRYKKYCFEKIQNGTREQGKKGTVIENDECKLRWDFEYHLRKTTTARRPDETIKYENKNRIFLVDMARSSKNNVDANHAEKIQKYPTTHRQTTRVQCNDNPNCYWLLGWRHGTSDILNWTTAIRRQENKSGIERNGEEGTI